MLKSSSITQCGGRRHFWPSGPIIATLCPMRHSLTPCPTSRSVEASRPFVSIGIPSRTVATRASFAGLTFVEGYIEVEEVEGMRVHMDGETPRVEYLVKWKVSQKCSSGSMVRGLIHPFSCCARACRMVLKAHGERLRARNVHYEMSPCNIS